MRTVLAVTCFFAVLALVLATGAPVLADDTHDGKVVRAGSGKLTMTDKDGKNEHTHDVPATAKITNADGKDCKLEDLKKGQNVKVTTQKKDGKDVVTKVEARKDDK
jgi:hypothetical protein